MGIEQLKNVSITIILMSNDFMGKIEYARSNQLDRRKQRIRRPSDVTQDDICAKKPKKHMNVIWYEMRSEM